MREVRPTMVEATAPAVIPRWVRLADVIALVLLVTALALIVGDGIRFDLGILRLSIRSATRASLWAVAIVVVRHALYVSPALPTRIVRGLRALPWRQDLAFAARLFAATRVTTIVIGLLAVGTIGVAADMRFRQFDNPWLNLPARWDAQWYADIAAIGYRWNFDTSVQQNVVFFPALPMMARTLGRLLGINVLHACWMIALAAFVWAMLLFVRLARLHLDTERAADSAWLLASYPFAIYFSAAYSESIFLLALCGAFLAVHEQRFLRAAAWGLLLGLTRPNGWLISVPLAVAVAFRRDVWRIVADTYREAGLRAIWRERRLWCAPVAAAAAPVLGMLLFTWYLHLQFGDGFAWLRGQAAWGRSYRGLDVLIFDRVKFIVDYGLATYLMELPFDALNFGAALLALLLIVPVARRLGLAYGTLVAVIVLPPLLVGGTMSIGRMTSVLFPVFIWLAAVLRRDLRTAVVSTFASVQGLAAVLFFTWRPLF